MYIDLGNLVTVSASSVLLLLFSLYLIPRESLIWIGIYKLLLARDLDPARIKTREPSACFYLYETLKNKGSKRTSGVWLRHAYQGGDKRSCYELALDEKNDERKLNLLIEASKVNYKDSLFRSAEILSRLKSSEYSWDDILSLFVGSDAFDSTRTQSKEFQFYRWLQNNSFSVKAASYVKELAEQGDPDALFIRGKQLDYQDKEKAFLYFVEAFKKGHSESAEYIVQRLEGKSLPTKDLICLLRHFKGRFALNNVKPIILELRNHHPLIGLHGARYVYQDCKETFATAILNEILGELSVIELLEIAHDKEKLALTKILKRVQALYKRVFSKDDVAPLSDQDIWREMSTAGGNSIANLSRGGKGIEYSELLLDLTKNLKIEPGQIEKLIPFESGCSEEANSCVKELNSFQKLVLGSEDKISLHLYCHSTQYYAEEAICQESFKQFYEGLSEEKRAELMSGFEKEVIKQGGKWNIDYASLSTAATIAAIQATGFGAYLFATTLVGSITSVLGITLPFGFYTAMTSTMSAMTNPIGWLAVGGYGVIKISSPNINKTKACVTIIGGVRQRLKFEPCTKELKLLGADNLFTE